MHNIFVCKFSEKKTHHPNNNGMNITEYTEVLRRRPFNWTFADPPTMESYDFERIDLFYWHNFVEETWRWSYYAGAAYIFTIFSLREIMRNRPALQLKRPLFCWNLMLGIFSMIGFARTAPEFLHVITQPNGLYDSVCVKYV